MLKRVQLMLGALVVYGAVGAVAQAAISRDERSESTAGERQEWQEARSPARGMGIVSDAFVTLSAFDFDVEGDSINLEFSRYCNLGPLACIFRAGVPVPHGATIVGAEIDACRDNEIGSVLLLISRVGGNETASEPLVLVEANPGCTYTREAGTPHLVDQYLDNYIAVVAVSGGDFQQRFQAVRVYYRSGDGEIVPTGVETSLFP